MLSVFDDSQSLPRFDSLNQDKNTDVLIIGGGMAGILTAFMLEHLGIDYILLEADRICGGVTANTTAKITSQHGLIYDKLIKEFGLEKARLYLRANEQAITAYARLCKDIDCDFETTNSYVYSINNPQKIDSEVLALRKIGYNAEFTRETGLPFSVAGAVKFKNQAQFNPKKFISEISKGLNIYENSRVLELKENIAITQNAKVTAKNIIVVTHFPFINKHGSYFLKLYQKRSYVIAVDNAKNLDGMYIDEAEGGFSFRNYGDMLFIGSGSHRTGKKSGGWNDIEAFAKQYYPNSEIKYKWATQDCISLDGIPYIGHYSKNTPNLYVATGFNKWGMTSSMVSALLLVDMITGKRNIYASLFSPSRTILRPQLAINAVEATMNLVSISKKRCPHLGCALKWNPYEHSWDCPCHGSRFSKEGKLLDNPATGDLK
ncbi:MAG: FAD-dependent oxidoreductase [Oscillospiraceae bacterium]|nr:FAD-dependent oxidoreductase [Oscillospiraceae bacterium]